MKILSFFQFLGKVTLQFIRELGKMGCFLGESAFWMFFPPYLLRRTIKQIHFFGVKTVLVILLTGVFTGMVLALHGYHTLVKVGFEARVGAAVALSLVRELGPVMAAIMATARAGSALTAEIGIMRITEQIDALDAMALNPHKYLVVPNLIAAIISLPILSAIFIVVGILGGYVVAVEFSGLASGTYFGSMANSVTVLNMLEGFYKALSFGLLVAWISCYKGYFAGYGAEGVSKATTQSVVLSCVMILVWDYFMTSLLILR